jgi:hypothetical protein
MLLLLPVQLPGFGTFADTTAKEVVPGRMTYNSVIASGSYVCDPDWSGSDGSLVLGSSTVACNSAGVSNKRTSKGTAALQRSCGIEAYNLAWQEGSFERHLTGPVSAWERRMALLTLAVEKWQICNPLTLYSTTLTAPLKELLVKRFRGEDALLKLCDAALVDSVRAAPR